MNPEDIIFSPSAQEGYCSVYAYKMAKFAQVNESRGRVQFNSAMGLSLTSVFAFSPISV